METYKYKNIQEYVLSLDDIILPAKEKYTNKDDIANIIKKILILGEQEIDPKGYVLQTYRTAVLSMIMQRYFLDENCTKRVLWFPELIKFKDYTVPLEVK